MFRDGVIEAPPGADRDVSEALCSRYGGTHHMRPMEELGFSMGRS